MNFDAQLTHGLDALALSLDAAQRQLLLEYLGLLHKWNQVYNLTAVREIERMLDHHILDSLAALTAFPVVETVSARVLDVGSGGGMPGIVFAIARPNWHLVLLDSNHKKTTFLQQTVIDLGLKNVEVVCERVENYTPAQGFDVITSRAFSELGEFTKLTRHLRASEGVWAALKGVYPYEEIAQLASDLKILNVASLSVPNLDVERHLVVIGADV